MRLILFPFSLIFAGIVSFRNFLFDRGIIKSVSYSLPVISVGNITVGGTGKTPMSEYILNILSNDFRCALLSRGYGRKTKGVLLADNQSIYTDIGDEPMQIKAKFKNILVAVAEKRNAGMEMLLKLPNPPEIVILDDAYQHRYIKPGLSILVIDYNRPVWKDFILPAGNLRGPSKNVKRADIVVINKCPNHLSEKAADNIKNRLKLSDYQHIYFTSIRYLEPVSMNEDKNMDFSLILKNNDNHIVAVAGIGNPKPFFEMAGSIAKLDKKVRFRDHYQYKLTDITKIIDKCIIKNKSHPILLTTEKDAVRMKKIPEIFHNFGHLIWYFPIELEFLFGEKDKFDNEIDKYVRRN